MNTGLRHSYRDKQSFPSSPLLYFTVHSPCSLQVAKMFNIPSPAKSSLPSAEVMALFEESPKCQPPAVYRTPRAIRLDEEHMRSQRVREACLLLDSVDDGDSEDVWAPGQVAKQEREAMPMCLELIGSEPIGFDLGCAWNVPYGDNRKAINEAREAREAALCRLRFRQRMLKRSAGAPWSPVSAN